MCLAISVLKIFLGFRGNFSVTFRDFPDLINVNATRFIPVHHHYSFIALC